LNRNEINWDDWDLVKSKPDKLKFLENVSAIRNLDIPELNSSNVVRFKILDINADLIPDILYNGPNNSDKNAVIILINDNGEYEKVYEHLGQVIHIKRRKPWLPISFEILNRKEKDDPYWELITYSHDLTAGELSFKLDQLILITDGMRIIAENMPPIPIYIARSEVRAKSQPSPSANVVHKCIKGQRGFAVASELHNDIIWWLILLDDEDYTFKTGWIESSNAKRL
jgi:hypothetical protein